VDISRRLEKDNCSKSRKQKGLASYAKPWCKFVPAY